MADISTTNAELSADDPGWKRAYFTVLGLSLVLISALVFEASRITEAFTKIRLDFGMEAPALVEFLSSCGTWGFVAFGGASLLIIAILFPWRKHLFSFILSVAVLLLCMATYATATTLAYTQIFHLITSLSR